MTFLTMEKLDLANKRVLIRADLNVPMEEGKISNDSRLRAALPTLQLALDQKARIILISHLGRPKEGSYDPAFSLKPVAVRLSQLLGAEVRFEQDWLNGLEVAPGEIVLCENVRFNIGEEDNDPTLAKKMASLCDVFIMDAFGTAHRAQASTVGVAQYAPSAAAGLLLTKELNALGKIFSNPKHPIVAIVGGAKVSTKLLILKSLLQRVDTLIVGGGIANTFIKALGYSVGNSLFEPDFIPDALKLLEDAKQQGKTIVIPKDVVVENTSNLLGSDPTKLNQVSKKGSDPNQAPNNQINIKQLSDITNDDKILDVGPQSSELYAAILKKANTIIWNGPVGVFEREDFAKGTQALAEAIAESPAFSVAGGGETIAAIDKFKVADSISYISTGGAAFLEFLEGKTLPAVAVLEARARIS